jgi:hypothetical protein
MHSNEILINKKLFKQHQDFHCISDIRLNQDQMEEDDANFLGIIINIEL